MEFIAPGGAGGGWDLTMRTVAKTLEETKLISDSCIEYHLWDVV
jgi:putative tricarboxylic transport membrane protein